MAGTCLREGELRFGKAGKPGHDEWRRAYPRTYPRAPILLYHPPTSSAQGSLREAFAEAGRWQRRLRGSFRERVTRAAPGLRPGSLRIPARSWLTTWVLRYRPPAYLSAMCCATASGLVERDALSGKRGPAFA